MCPPPWAKRPVELADWPLPTESCLPVEEEDVVDGVLFFCITLVSRRGDGRWVTDGRWVADVWVAVPVFEIDVECNVSVLGLGSDPVRGLGFDNDVFCAFGSDPVCGFSNDDPVWGFTFDKGSECGAADGTSEDCESVWESTSSWFTGCGSG